MASIFRKDDNFSESPKRNTYDMSFQNNLTTDFGSLRPCGIWPVQPGDSWRFKPTYGLRFLPLTFPIQTRMKASIHYFYVRNRNLWKDWQDFIGKTKTGLTPPYIHLTESNRKMVETSQLGDFLGIPTEVYDDVFKGEHVNFDSFHVTLSDNQYSFNSDSSTFLATRAADSFDTLALGSIWNSVFTNVSSANDTNRFVYVAPVSALQLQDNSPISVKFGNDVGLSTIAKVAIFDGAGLCKYISEDFSLDPSDLLPKTVTLEDYNYDDSWTYSPNYLVVLFDSAGVINTSYDPSPVLNLGRLMKDKISAAELPLSSLPWRSDENPTGIPLSALPFRAYESIYNSFYRNAENNPLLINGVPEYNKWCRTQEGGADTNFYPIMYHNWEDDFLTTAVPSPQQGSAPLVGLSGTPTLTIGHDDGTTTTMELGVDDDGNVTAANAVSGDEATQQAIVEAVSYGISINDFRNVNSFQRWLENNIRRGYKYRDQIKTHYGVSVRYDELDMPEFIGGTSQPVMVNQISQTTPTEGSPLGDMAGQASAIGSGSEITHYCDEHGFIIAILCVKPVANYSQLLPKFFNVTDTFDYYFPEFGHIGMQPITYKEVTPLQANLEGKLDDVFGYQRAWYDLISKTDEVHGLFRSDFRNFLINRTFDGTPELGKEFTVMDPNQLNEVFAVTENTDKILGQIYMDISKKTAIPLFGIPRLE